MTSLYLWLKFLHVAAVIVWIGGTTVIAALTNRAAGTDDPADIRNAIGVGLYIGPRIVGPASGLALLLGLFAVWAGHLRILTPWVVWGLLGFLAHVLIGGILLRKNGERIHGLAGAGSVDHVQLKEALGRQRGLAALYLLTMLSVIWAMVMKPQ